MKNIKNKFKINGATYGIILTFLLTGLIKNIILIYIIIIIHELGHIITIKGFHYQIKKVEIYPMGGVTSVDKKINSSVSKDIIIGFMGIGAQILLFFIFDGLFKINLISYNTFNLFKTYNKTIMIFNLIPMIPLDGYVIVKGVLELLVAYKKAFYLSGIISILSMGLFITYNEVLSLNNYLIISFLIYKLIKEIKNFKFLYWRFLIERYLAKKFNLK